MPQAIPAIIIAAGQAIVAGAITTQIIVGFVVNVGLAYLSESLSKKTGSPGPPAVNVTINDTVEPRHGVIGTRRIGGSYVYVRTSSDDPTVANKFLWYVIAYADHQCNALRDAWFDEFKVPEADIDGSTGAVATAWANNKVWIWSHLGTGNQTADPQLTSTFSVGADWIKWTSTDRLRGVCYRVVKMERDDVAFPTGAPDAVSSIVEGALLYDMRLDSTNGGSGSHRKDNPSTWEFSNNWGLGMLWLVTGGSVVNDQATRLVKYGIKEDYSRIDWAFWAAAANVSDQSLSGANAPPSGAQARYTLDFEWVCDQSRKEILDLAIAAGAGELVYVHGKWRLYAGAYDTPVHSFDQDDLRGDMEVEDTTDEQERVNRVAGVYIDPEQQWKEQTTPYRFNAAYDTQDQGREFQKEIDLRSLTDSYRAQRVCELELRKARQMRRVVFRFGRNGMKVAPFETFYFSHVRYGWVNKEFRCIKRKRERTDSGGVITVITARAELASIYTDLVTADYLTGTSVTNSIQSETPSAPSGIKTTGVPNGILLEWTKPSLVMPGTNYEVQESTSSSMSSPTTRYEGPDLQVLIPKTSTSNFYFRVRAKRSGQISAWNPPSGGVLGKASASSATLAATVTPGTATSGTGAASQTTNSVTVTAFGGTAPYTYAWTFASGGTGITRDSPTAATTTFSATSLTGGETRTGQARCTVTDNVGATFTIDVAVEIERPPPVVTAPSVDITPLRIDPTNASAAFRIDSDAHWYSSNNTSTPATDQGLWVNPSSFSADYEVRVTRTGGSETAFTSGPALNTWLALTSDREWRLTQTTIGSKNILFTIEIRRASDSVVVSTTTGNELGATVQSSA